ncbi:MAG: ABC transporter substrate-binding protein [Microvirga sp.]|jgi:branched-chain amino acid transport system substrate-binding protein
MKTLGALVVSASVLAIVGVSAQTTAKMSDDVVKIGLILDMSSLYSDITGTGSVAAAQMAIDDFGGKIAGKPIQLVHADHQNKPDLAANTAREWFDRQHVDAILDVAASATALAAVEVGKEKNKIVVLNGPGAARLTNEACTPISVHYTYDTYSLALTTGQATVKRGGDSWFFITADYAFGHELERDTTAVVKSNGGQVLGSVRAPLNNADFSSFLLQAQASKAKVVGLANAGTDTTNAIKQAAEFGLTRSGQSLAGLLVYVNDVKALGLQAAGGMLLTEAFYWDLNDETRAWSKRFFDKTGKMPNMSQAGLYSATMHYLRAVQAAGTDQTTDVMKVMKETPINDFFAKNGKIREDGRMVHDMYLFEVKKPSESQGPWDLYKLVATVPGSEAFQALDKSRCPLVRK